MDFVGSLVLIIIGVFVGGSVGYVVWRSLDRSDTDELRSQIEGLERRLKALEADRTNPEDSA